jgi:hypothetical protein
MQKIPRIPALLAPLALLLALMLSVTLPALAVSVDISIISRLTPAACTPTLSNGGTIDYGMIKPSQLSADSYRVLPEKQLDFTIICDAPAKVAVRTINGRPNTMAGVTENSLGTALIPAPVFGAANQTYVGVGLGLDGDAKIGGYGIRIVPNSTYADSTAVDSVQSNDNGTNWQPSSGNMMGNGEAPLQMTWAQIGSTVPTAFITFNAKLAVQAYLNKISNLNLTHPIVLDGVATIELIYL